MALAGLILTVAIGIGESDEWRYNMVLEVPPVHEITSNMPQVRSVQEAQLDDEANRWTGSRAVPGRVAAVGVEIRAAPDSKRWGREGDILPEVQAIICAEGTPWPCDWALALAFCESSFNVEAWATEIVRGVRYWFHGWFQHISDSPEPGRLADPVYNTALAAEKYRSEKGVGHWPACP